MDNIQKRYGYTGQGLRVNLRKLCKMLDSSQWPLET